MLGVVVGSRIGQALAMSIRENITFHCLVLDVAAYSVPKQLFCLSDGGGVSGAASRAFIPSPHRGDQHDGKHLFMLYNNNTQLGFSQEPSKAAEVINGFIDDGLCSAVHEF